MNIIHTSFKKRKKSKPTAKQRELDAQWQQLLDKYKTKPISPSVKSIPEPKVYVRETPKHPSLNSGHHDTFLKPAKVYTGTKIKGIGTMHKSNAVPIFSDEEAHDIAHMRR